MNSVPNKQVNDKVIGSATLLLANILTLYFYISDRSSIEHVLWIYYVQSLIIGAVNVMRIRALNEFRVDNFKMDGKPVEKSEKTKKYLAITFGNIYGFIHFVLLIFMFQIGGVGATDVANPLNFNLGIFVISVVAFAFHHFLAFLPEKKLLETVSEADAPHIINILIKPFLRIIPIFMIIFIAPLAFPPFYPAGDGTVLIIAFIIFKTSADVGLHLKRIGHLA